MANGKNKIKYEEYKSFSEDEKSLFQFNAFSRLNDLPHSFAGKWVERTMVIILGSVGLAVLGAIVGTVVMAKGG